MRLALLLLCLATAQRSAHAAYSDAVLEAEPWIYFRFDDANATHLHNSGTAGSAGDVPYNSESEFSYVDGEIGAMSASPGGVIHSAGFVDAFNPPSSFTIEMWLYIGNDTAGTLRCPISSRFWDGNNGYWGYMIYVYDNSIVSFGLGGEAQYSWVGVTSDNHLEEETWYHLAATYEANNGSQPSQTRLYIDGELWAQADGQNYRPNLYVWTSLFAGNNDGDPNWFWQGLIDEVAIYNISLSADEVEYHAMLGRCSNGVQDDLEEGVDCGGVCDSCVSCDNGVVDGTETDVDCGGESCPPCDTSGAVRSSLSFFEAGIALLQVGLVGLLLSIA